MLTRRILLTFGALLGLMIPGLIGHAAAQPADQVATATGFIQQAGKQLVDVVNGTEGDSAKAGQLQMIVDRIVDVNEIGRFVLGRYWRTATEAQRNEYMQLFHKVLLNNITSKIGEFRGVGFAMGRSTLRGDGTVFVGTIITRPNNAPADAQWVVSFASGGPKIIDIVAEGTSLRLTQRSDYASYLARNNNDIAALIAALHKQVGG